MKNANPVFPGAVRIRKSGAWSGWLDARRPAARFAIVSALAVATALAFAGCGDNKSAAMPAVAATPPKPVEAVFPIKVGDKAVRVQLVVNRDEMERGLMDRRDLGRDDGMLFVYPQPQQLQFWMRNTAIPLDIGFFDPQGLLEEIYPMHPFDENTVNSRSTLLLFALEMNQGWFSANTVRPGAQLDLKAVAAALKARGFDPVKFGLKE